MQIANRKLSSSSSSRNMRVNKSSSHVNQPNPSVDQHGLFSLYGHDHDDDDSAPPPETHEPPPMKVNTTTTTTTSARAAIKASAQRYAFKAAKLETTGMPCMVATQSKQEQLRRALDLQAAADEASKDSPPPPPLHHGYHDPSKTRAHLKMMMARVLHGCEPLNLVMAVFTVLQYLSVESGLTAGEGAGDILDFIESSLSKVGTSLSIRHHSSCREPEPAKTPLSAKTAALSTMDGSASPWLGASSLAFDMHSWLRSYEAFVQDSVLGSRTGSFPSHGVLFDACGSSDILVPLLLHQEFRFVPAITRLIVDEAACCGERITTGTRTRYCAQRRRFNMLRGVMHTSTAFCEKLWDSIGQVMSQPNGLNGTRATSPAHVRHAVCRDLRYAMALEFPVWAAEKVKAEPPSVLLPAFCVEFNSCSSSDYVLHWALRTVEGAAACTTCFDTTFKGERGAMHLGGHGCVGGGSETSPQRGRRLGPSTNRHETRFALYLLRRCAASFPFLLLRHVDTMALVVENASALLPTELAPAKEDGSAQHTQHEEGSGSSRLRTLLDILGILEAMSSTLAHELDCLRSAVLGFMGIMNSLETFPQIKGRETGKGVTGKGVSCRSLVDKFGDFLRNVEAENSQHLKHILSSPMRDSFDTSALRHNVLHVPYSPRKHGEGTSRKWIHVLDKLSTMYPDGPMRQFVSTFADPVVRELKSLLPPTVDGSPGVTSSDSDGTSKSRKAAKESLDAELIQSLKLDLSPPVHATSYPSVSFSFLHDASASDQEDTERLALLPKLEGLQELVRALEGELAVHSVHFVDEFLALLRYQLHPSLLGHTRSVEVVRDIQTTSLKLLLKCLQEGCTAAQQDAVMRLVLDACSEEPVVGPTTTATSSPSSSASSSSSSSSTRVGHVVKSCVQQSLFDFLCHCDRAWSHRILSAVLRAAPPPKGGGELQSTTVPVLDGLIAVSQSCCFLKYRFE